MSWMRALPCDVYDLEPGPCYENEKPVLACRETVSWYGNCQSLLTTDSNTVVGIAPDTFLSIRPEGETLVPSISMPPEDICFRQI
ncbi:MAG: hypothetical protein ACOC6R_02710 [Chloroflexota bacterium]